MAITAEAPGRNMTAEFPPAVPVLESFGIDDCCGGKSTLAETSTRRQPNLASVLEKAERQQSDGSVPDAQWQQTPLTELIEYIVRKHHAFTRKQIRLIVDLLDKVEQRHGPDHPEIFQVSKAFAVVSTELTHHLYCEENILFPYIAQLGTDRQSYLPPIFGGVQQPVTHMMMEHDQIDNELRVLRELTNNYVPPTVVCPTWRALYRALEDLEQDLRQHMHVENRTLFPRILELGREAA